MSEVQTRMENFRAEVFKAEDRLRELEPVELRYEHYFSHGVYARAMFIPAGTIVTGKIHKYTNLNVLLCGRLSVRTEKGIIQVKPPFVVVSPPGTKRIAYAHEDSIWLTIHGTEETDVEKIERKFVAQTEQEFLEFCEQQKLVDKEALWLGER
jgi:hypothetical protein